MKNSTERIVVSILTLVCIGLMPLRAWADNNGLQVKCVDASGTALSGIKVQIQHLNTGKWKDKKSDGKGSAAFNKLDDGVYRVLARKEGFAPSTYEFVLLKDAKQASVTLKFESGDMAQPLYFEDRALTDQAYQSLSKGVEALRAGKFEEAAKELGESVKLNPSNPEGHLNLAIAHIQQHDWDTASAILTRASEMTRTLRELPLPPASAGQNPYDDLLVRIDTLNAKIPSLRIRTEGDKALAEKRFDDAIMKYSEAVKLESGDPDLYYNLGLSQANAKKYDDALKSIEKALELKPTETAYHDLKKQVLDYKDNAVLMQARDILREGDKLFQSGDYAEALKKYAEARPMLPEANQAGVWLQEGKTHAQLKQGTQAVEAFKKAIAISPDNADYKKAFAQYYMSEKQYDEALNIYSESSTAGTADQTLFDLGQNLSKQGNSEVAQLAFERAVKANPNHAESCYELGMLLYYGKNDDAKAKELLSKYLEIGKQNDHLDNARTVLVVIKKRSP